MTGCRILCGIVALGFFFAASPYALGQSPYGNGGQGDGFNPYGNGDESTTSPYQGSTKEQDNQALRRMWQHDEQEQERAAAVAREERRREHERREAERAEDRERAEQERAARAASQQPSPVVQGIIEGLKGLNQQTPPTVVAPQRPAPRAVVKSTNQPPAFANHRPADQPSTPAANLVPCGTAIVLPTDRRSIDCGSHGGATGSSNANPQAHSSPSGGSNGLGGRPSSGSAPGNSAVNSGNACANMNSFVTFTSSHPTGIGHCPGEITGRITNHSSQALWCVYAFYSNGVKTADGGGGTLSPGQTTGGESAGLYSCGADTIKYACFPNSPDPYGCKVNF